MFQDFSVMGIWGGVSSVRLFAASVWGVEITIKVLYSYVSNETYPSKQ